MSSGKSCRMLFLALALAPCLCPGAGYYEVVHILYPGHEITWARDINNDGVVVGSTGRTGYWLPYVRLSDGSFRYIGSYTSYSGARSINSAGDVAIWASPNKILTPDDQAIPLPAGDPQSINNSRQVLMYDVLPGDSYISSFIYDPATKQTNLLDPTRTFFSQASSMNDSMWVAGSAWSRDNSTKGAFLYRPSTGMAFLPAPQGAESYARGVNNKGVVVGAAENREGTIMHAAIWDRQRRIHRLDPLGGDYAMAVDINEAGDVVGLTQPSYAAQVAFLYKDGQMHDLNHLTPPGCGWRLTGADAINDCGQIVAYGLPPGGTRVQGCLLNPPLEMSVSRLIRGQAAEIRVTGSRPRELVLFFMSVAGTGDGPCYDQYGFCLDILEPKYIGRDRANKFGVAKALRGIPGNARLVEVFFQAVVARNGEWIVLDPVSARVETANARR